VPWLATLIYLYNFLYFQTTLYLSFTLFKGVYAVMFCLKALKKNLHFHSHFFLVSHSLKGYMQLCFVYKISYIFISFF